MVRIMTCHEIASAALALPPESRATLVEMLLASLEPIDIKYHEEWEKEIEDRITAYERGEMELISREEVMRKLGKRS